MRLIRLLIFLGLVVAAVLYMMAHTVHVPLKKPALKSAAPAQRGTTMKK